MIYTLKPRNRIFDTSVAFPPLPEGKKIGIALSGGMESSLIGKIAIDVYGADRVVFFVFDTLFSRNDALNAEIVLANFERIYEEIGGVESHQLTFDYAIHMADRTASLSNIKVYLEETYPYVDCLYFGFTKLFFDVEPLNCMENPTVEKIREACHANPEQFERVIEEFHIDHFDDYAALLMDMKIVPEVYEFLRNTPTVKCPFSHLDKAEIIDLYYQLGYKDLLYKTWSCTTMYSLIQQVHCGQCFNCQERLDGHRQLNLPDLTEYAHDDITKVV